MKEYFLLNKDRLKSFLKAVIKNYCLITPQPATNGDFLLQETEDLERINLNYDITSNTLKEFFFPARETIFRYQKKEGSFKITPLQEKVRQMLFFGVRSCDVRALNFQDHFFSQEPKDELYGRRREKGIIISFACKKPIRDSCFCVFAGGPCLKEGEGFDLQFIDFGRDYLVEVALERGAKFIKRYKRFFTLADTNVKDKKASLEEKCLMEFKRKYDIMKVHQKLKNIELKDLWEELGKRCTNCGGCEFICPTCFCFYTQDIENSKRQGERIRAWDSCTFSGYSRMSGDVNPHEKNSNRISRRFFCKLYNCYNWFGIFGCTGCGRCSFVCPVNLDMESFINSLMRSDKYQPLLKEL